MKTELIKFRVSEDEKNKLLILTSRSSANSLSEYIRWAALNKKITTRFDNELVLSLLRVNADLARLGNLFRMTLRESSRYTPEQLKIIESELLSASRKIKEMVSQ